MNLYLGIDLGGSNVRVAIVNEKGEVLETVIRPSLAQQGPEIVLNNIIEMSQSLKSLGDCVAVGVGVPGPVDTQRGVMTLSTNIKGFTNYPVVKFLEDHFKLPVIMDNDANVAGLAEAVFGAGKGKESVYYLTHSTGIGGALVINGTVVSGRKGYAGEIGNIVIDPQRPAYLEINNLNAGAIENEASGPAMVRKAQKLIDPEIQFAQEIFHLADKNNLIAQEIIKQMAYDMAILLQGIALVVDPHVFVIGGGVSQSKNQYWDTMIKYYQDLVHTNMRDTEFVLAKLKEPGVIGAAALCFSHQKGQSNE